MSDEQLEIVIGEEETTWNGGDQPHIDKFFGEDDGAKSRKDRLITYLQKEIDDERDSNERYGLKQFWKIMREMSHARPETATKNTPWENASNVVPPFLFSNINGVASHLKAAMIEKKPRFKGHTDNKKFQKNAKAVTKWINKMLESDLHVNLPKQDGLICWDLARMGIVVLEVPWFEKRTQFKRETEGQIEKVDRITYSGPKVKMHRIEDVYTRAIWTDEQESPYIGFREPWTQQDMERLKYDGFFPDWEPSEAIEIEIVEESRREEHEKIGTDDMNVKLADEIGSAYEVYKFYIRFDADGDGMHEELIVWFAKDVHKLLRVEYNELGVRPVPIIRYVAIPQWFYGHGVGFMLQDIQEEITTLHNMRVDNLHLSSRPVTFTREGSGMDEDKTLSPGEMISTMDPQLDVNVITIPNNSGQMMDAEHMAMQYGRMITGISETQLGMPDTTAKSGTSPTLQQFLAQQGNKILRNLVANAELGYGKIPYYVLLQCVANSDVILDDPQRRLLSLVPTEDIELVEEVLKMNVEDIPMEFQFTMRSTEVDETDDAKRQQMAMQMQMYVQGMMTVMQLKGQIENPQVPPGVKELANYTAVGIVKLLEETLRLLSVENADEMLPDVEKEALMLELLETMKQPEIKDLERALERLERYGNQAQGGPVQEIGGGPGIGGPGGMGAVPPVPPGSQGSPVAPVGGGGGMASGSPIPGQVPGAGPLG
jgi:hypothetical protein